MLGNRFTARIASHHSPTRERRELFFATPVPGSSDPLEPDVPEKADANPNAAERQNTVAATLDDERKKSADRVRASVASSGDPAAKESLDLPDATIESVRDSIRKRINTAVKGILDLPDLQHSVAENPLFNIPALVQQERVRLFQSLETRLGGESAEELRKRLPFLWAEFLPHIDRLNAFRTFIEAVNEEEEDNPARAEEIARLPADQRPDFLRGYYNPKLNKVIVNKHLPPAEKADVVAHERGHALLYATEHFLKKDLFTGHSENIIKDAQLDDRLQTIGKQYIEYGVDTPDARDKTLARRYAQSRTSDLTEGSREEQAIFEQLDRQPAFRPEILGRAWEEALVKDMLRTEDPALLEDAVGFAAALQELPGDPDVGREYAMFRGNPDTLIRKLVARFHRWNGLPPAEQAERFPSGTETALFRSLLETQPRHVEETVLQSLDGMREDARRNAAMDAMLVGLGLGRNTSEKYRMYGDDRPALWEELLNRNADYKAGRDPDSFTHLDEVCLFAMLDPAFAPRPPFTKEMIDARIAELTGIAPTPGEGEATDRDRLRAATGRGEEAEEAEEGGGDRIIGYSLIGPIEQLEGKMHTALREMVEVEEMVPRNAKPDDAALILKELNMQSKDLAEAAALTGTWKKSANLIAKWEDGDMDPAVFLASARELMTDAEFKSLERAMAELCPPDEWRKADKETRKAMVMRLQTQSVLKTIKTDVKTWDDHMVKISDYVEKVRALDKSNAAQRAEAGGLGIEWFSISNVIGAVKNVFESYKKAFDEWSQLKESKLSKKFGDITKGFPGSDRALITLEMELDHKNDETKDNFKKHLEHDLATFEHCAQGGHGHLSMLEQTRSDANRFRGTLEYMASKGWLYDLDIKNRMVFGIPMEVGINLPANWTEQRRDEYLKDLEQQQSKGESSEAERGKSRVNNFPDIQLMIPVLEDELERRNYWATFGILERIVEKGKIGESPIWASVVIFDKIRKDPTARKFFPKKLLDKYGNNGLPNGMIHKFFKVDRNEIERFQKNTAVPFEEAGNLAKIISAVERTIKEKQKNAGLPELQPDDLKRKVAQVIAGQLVEGRGGSWSCHLYDDKPPEFREYRTLLNGFDNTIEPGSIDDDYYNPKNQRSELHLGSLNYYIKILVVASQGSFVNGEKAQMFIETLIRNYRDLKTASDANPKLRKAFANYVKSVRYKMNNVVESWTLSNASQTLAYKGTDDSCKGRPIILELVRCGLLDEPKFKSGITDPLNEQIAKWKAREGPKFYYDNGADLKGVPDDR